MRGNNFTDQKNVHKDYFAVCHACVMKQIGAMFLAAVATYQRVPPSLRVVLDSMADGVNQTPVQFVEQALKNSSLAAVMAEAEQRYTQHVKGK